ncbi:hypothetical protein ACH4Q7_22710 [Streptomyces roseolus]|uniref:hypothetical protein n=1 Tax=Streptomyces roseolus TaxID=67358 RepID=UPI0037971362
MPTPLISATLAEAIAKEAAARDLGPFEEGRLFRLLVDAGHGSDDIARWYGCLWVSEVRLKVELLGLADNARNAVDEGVLPLSLAYSVSRLSEPNQQLMLNRWTRGEFASASRAAKYADAIYEDEHPLLSF